MMMSMRRSEGDEKGEEEEEQGIWGTWEELVLACAVSRHGTGKWDSVAVEVGSRAGPRNHHLLTPQSCRRRFGELRRRYEGVGGQREETGEEDHDNDGGGGVGGGAGCGVSVPWLDDLRQIRVAELRREVERYDVSIVSLQLKVKKLTEERERSLHSSQPVDNEDEPDPDAIHDGESAGSPPDQGTEAVKAENGGGDDARGRRGDVGGGVRVPDPAAATAGEAKGQQPAEGSCDGSSDTVAKDGEGTAAKLLVVEGPAPAADPTATEPRPVTGSEAAAAAAVAVDKESSDVQSSASQASSQKKRRGMRGGRRRRPPGSSAAMSSSSLAVSSGGGGGFDEEVSRPRSRSSGREEDEEDEEEQEQGTRRTAGVNGEPGSRPLGSLLDAIRSHKYGSVFRRRMPAQETARYRGLIRQHMDLDSIRRRLDDPAYSAMEMFRDLHLMCANATVFFPKGSDEHTAAMALRAAVANELAADREQSSNRSTSSSGAGAAAAAAATTATATTKPGVVPKLEAAPDLPAFLEKPGSALVACRKRSAVSATAGKAAAVKAEPRRKVVLGDESEEDEEEEKKKKVVAVEEEVQKKPPQVLGAKLVEKPFKRGLRTTKSRGASVGTKPAPIAAAAAAATSVKPEAIEQRPAQEKAETARPAGGGDLEACSSNSGPSTPGIAASPPPTVVAKKRSAAGFLKRLKGSMPSSPPTAGEADEVPTHVEQKKGFPVKVMAKEKVATAAQSGRPHKEEPETQPKRKGRPPKRKAAPPPLTPPSKRPRSAAAVETAVPLARLRGGNRKRD